MANTPELAEFQRRLAGNLARLRHRRRWSQQQAADAMVIDLKHLQKLEYGNLNPTLRTLVAASAAFEVPIGRLFAPIRSAFERRPVGRPKGKRTSSR